MNRSAATEPDALRVDIDALAEHLRRDTRVALATLFGSAQDGLIRPGSDLDLAVLFGRTLSADEFLAFYGDLCDQLPAIERVDLVSLEQANPILAFEALSGRILCTNMIEEAAAFYSLVCREYEDVMGNLEHQRHLAA